MSTASTVWAEALWLLLLAVAAVICCVWSLLRRGHRDPRPDGRIRSGSDASRSCVGSPHPGLRRSGCRYLRLLPRAIPHQWPKR